GESRMPHDTQLDRARIVAANDREDGNQGRPSWRDVEAVEPEVDFEVRLGGADRQVIDLVGPRHVVEMLGGDQIVAIHLRGAVNRGARVVWVALAGFAPVGLL